MLIFMHFKKMIFCKCIINHLGAWACPCPDGEVNPESPDVLPGGLISKFGTTESKHIFAKNKKPK